MIIGVTYNITYETMSKIYFFHSKSNVSDVRDKFSERFKVNRLPGKEEIRLIGISTLLWKTGKTTTRMTRKRLSQK